MALIPIDHHCWPTELQAKPNEPRTRTFKLDYAVSISGLKAGDKIRVWLPEPLLQRRSDDHRAPRTIPGYPADERRAACLEIASTILKRPRPNRERSLANRRSASNGMKYVGFPENGLASR